MINIKVAGQYLDLAANTTSQIDRNTSLLLGDAILGEFSLPITIPRTDRNAVILGFITNFGAVKTEKQVKHENAEYYEDGILMFRGTLVAEVVNIDLLTPSRGNISVYFLTAISAFYSMCNGVMLRDIDLGGKRVINNFTDHVLSTLINPVNIGYTFAPIYNESYKDDETEKALGVNGNMMNPIAKAANQYGWTIDLQTGRDRMAPQLYLSYLIKRCFSHFGYTVEGNIFSDIDFNNAIIPSFQSIYWADWSISNNPDITPVAVPISPVSFNLNEHVPKDYSVSRFLISVFNYYGLAPVFDNIGLRCTLISLNTIEEDSTRKNFSNKVNPTVKIEFEKVRKVYGIQLNFDDRDSLISKPDMTKYTRLPDIQYISDLPAAREELDMHIILIRTRNWFYECAYQDDSGQYKWMYMADNIYDYSPAGVTDNISTDLTPVSLREIEWQSLGGVFYSRALFGSVNQEGNWPGKRGEFLNWGLRIMYYHGMRSDSTGLPGNYYPFASSHMYNVLGFKVANYSLALNTDSGIITRFWAKWLTTLSSYEIVTLSYNLSFADYLNLSWRDLILIRSNMLLNIQQTVSIPWRGTVDCKALRIVKIPCNAAVGGITVTYTGGTTAVCDFIETVPGAKKWVYAIDGGQPTTIYDHPFTIPATPGNHSISISPMCGFVPNPGGAAQAAYEIKSLQGNIFYSCSTGNTGQQGRVIITIAFTAPTTVPLSLLFGSVREIAGGVLQYIGSDIFNPPEGSEPHLGEDAHAPYIINIPVGTTTLTTTTNIYQKGFSDDGVHVWSCTSLAPIKDIYVSIDRPVPLRANFFTPDSGYTLHNV